MSVSRKTGEAFRWVLFGAGLFLALQFVTLVLRWQKQAQLAFLCILSAAVLSRASKSRTATLTLIALSVLASMRYGWWRVHAVIDYFLAPANHRITIDSFLLLVLLSAEAYAFLVMVLGYLQMVWPLHRKPVPLPDNPESWPDVDVLIPTYNEPLAIVRYTALAAAGIDYPPEKLHVYILDDGRRPEFRDFAAAAGVGYITRPDNRHAKAGNINHALAQLQSPLVAIFDCDHVPTRSFLQVALGWFFRDPRLGMLQTPHHFYSPDPFERNLNSFRAVPNEGELFYGVVQDGNDFWNATFFCGSCAVLRRSALDEIGGIATETVTEDAHTSLLMQMRGWNTAYINLPQAAGLATERLSAHIGQRIRWARGMIQILRRNNPLFARGLKLPQRLCYFNAMLHFLYAVPRLVFLTAPLAYMLLGHSIIPGYWVAILAYAAPHLALSNMANSRIQGRHRHSFWNEIYEAVLAPYILAPTLLALVNPKLGKFNVTDKGGVVDSSYFDRHIAKFTIGLLLLNFAGLLATPYRLIYTDPQHPGTVFMNVAWILFNIVILGAAAAVAFEAQQRRGAVRINFARPAGVRFADGTVVDGQLVDMSASGAAISLARPASSIAGELVKIILTLNNEKGELPASIVDPRGDVLRLHFQPLTLAEEEVLTRVLYSPADNWLSSRAAPPADQPLRSLWNVVRISFSGQRHVLQQLLPWRWTGGRPAAGRAEAALPLILLLCLAAAPRAAAAARFSSIALPAAAAGLQPGTFSRTLTFRDAGQEAALDLPGPGAANSFAFTLPVTEVVRQATLTLRYHFSTGQAAAGVLKIALNGTVFATLDAPQAPSPGNSLLTASLPVPSGMLIRKNVFTFQVAGPQGPPDASGQATGAAGSIEPSSSLEISGDLLPLASDLSLLPLPFYDSGLETETTIPFVFLSPPSEKSLQAAGIVASWFGMLSVAHPVRFSVVIGAIPAGNAVVFSGDPAQLPEAFRSRLATGRPSVAMFSNPADSYSKVLLFSGSNADQVLTAAQGFAIGSKPLSGDAMTISGFPMPPPRAMDDAPRWLPTDRLAPLWDDSAVERSQQGGQPPLAIYVRVPPDLYYGERSNLDLYLDYRYNGTPVSDKAALRFSVNGFPVADSPLRPEPDSASGDHQHTILLPISAMRPFANTFLFDFHNGETQPAAMSASSQGSILKSSLLDLRGLAHWAALPDIELFANAGFPFTRFADLAQTTVVLPPSPAAEEISLFLYLMGHFGAQTGYPALRVTVAAPQVLVPADQDYLVLGSTTDQPAFGTLAPSLPVTFGEDGLQAKTGPSFRSRLRVWVHRAWAKLPEESFAGNLRTLSGSADAMIEGVESPYGHSRTIVVVALKNPSAADSLAAALIQRAQSSDVSGSVSILHDGQFTSYRVGGSPYHVGDISSYAAMRAWLEQYFGLLFAAVGLFCFLLASTIYTWLARHAAARLEKVEA